MNPDAVVIGGGPAGLAAAIALGRQGVTTCLVERRQFPIDKACGEGLLPNGVQALEGFGITRAELARVGKPLKGIRYMAASGATAEARFENGDGLGLRRVHLSSLLLDRARAHGCLRIVTGETARVRPRPLGGAEVDVAGARFTPRLLVVADGLGSPTAEALGIRTVVRQPRRWGARQHVGGESWSDRVEVYFSPGCEVYVTPVDNGVNVAVLWAADRARWPPGDAVIESALRRFPTLRRRLEGRVRTDRPRAAGPFYRWPAERVRGGVVLLGDAAGYTDALTGEGVGLALTQAAIFEVLVARPLAQRAGTTPVSAADLQGYDRAAMRATRANHRLTRLLLALSARPALVERLIQGLGQDPALFRHCLAVNMGERPLWRVPFRSLIRLPWMLTRSMG